MFLHCSFLFRGLIALIFIKIDPKLSYFCQKNANFLSAVGSAPDPRNNSPLQISGHLPALWSL